MFYTTYISRWGKLVAAIDESGAITGLWFEGQKYFPSIPTDAIWIEASVNDSQVQKSLNRLKNQLKEYEEGKRHSFDLNLSPKGTEFQKIVWDILLTIPYGKTITYGEIGHKVASILKKESMSAQAIGGAVGHNPISILIPCHRVIGKKNDLVGYAGGIDKKAGLLEHEK